MRERERKSRAMKKRQMERQRIELLNIHSISCIRKGFDRINPDIATAW